MEDITIVLAHKQPLTAIEVHQARERILAEGAAAERARIRQLALDEAGRLGSRQDDLYGEEKLSAGDRLGHKAEALRDFAALPEDR